MTVAEFIEQLEKLDQKALILTAEYDPVWGGFPDLHYPNISTSIFVDEDLNDVTDKERERDILAYVIL